MILTVSSLCPFTRSYSAVGTGVDPVASRFQVGSTLRLLVLH